MDVGICEAKRYGGFVVSRGGSILCQKASANGCGGDADTCTTTTVARPINEINSRRFNPPLPRGQGDHQDSEGLQARHQHSPQAQAENAGGAGGLNKDRPSILSVEKASLSSHQSGVGSHDITFDPF